MNNWLAGLLKSFSVELQSYSNFPVVSPITTINHSHKSNGNRILHNTPVKLFQ